MSTDSYYYFNLYISLYLYRICVGFSLSHLVVMEFNCRYYITPKRRKRGIASDPSSARLSNMSNVLAIGRAPDLCSDTTKKSSKSKWRWRL